MVLDPSRLSRSRLDRALPDFSGENTRGFIERLAEHRTYASFLQGTIAANRRPQLLLSDVHQQGCLGERAAVGVQVLGANEDLKPRPGIGWVSAHLERHRCVFLFVPSSRSAIETSGERSAACR